MRLVHAGMPHPRNLSRLWDGPSSGDDESQVAHLSRLSWTKRVAVVGAGRWHV
jgi:hypothetical protein